MTNWYTGNSLIIVFPTSLMDFAALNYLAILVAAFAAFAIGFLWHGPLFGKTWMKLMNITPEQMERGKEKMQKKMPLYMLLALIQQLIVAGVIAMLVSALGITTVAGALMLAFWLWLGFSAAAQINGVLWEERPVNLYLFNIVYHLVIIVVATLIVSLWQ